MRTRRAGEDRVRRCNWLVCGDAALEGAGQNPLPVRAHRSRKDRVRRCDWLVSLDKSIAMLQAETGDASHPSRSAHSVPRTGSFKTLHIVFQLYHTLPFALRIWRGDTR